MKRKSKPKAPPPRPLPGPSVWWMACLLLGGYAALGLRKPEALGPPSWLAEQGLVLDPHHLFLGAVGVALAGLVGGLHYLNRYAFARLHIDEPWRWDYAWRRELVDEQLSTLLLRLPSILALAVVFVFLHGLVLVGLVDPRSPLPVILVFGVFTLAFDVAFIPREFLPFARDVLALLRQPENSKRRGKRPATTARRAPSPRA